MFEFFSNLLKNFPDWLLLLTVFVASVWTMRSLILSLFQSFRGSIGALIGLALLAVTVCVYIQVAASVPAGSENWAIGLSIGGALIGVLSALRRHFLEQQSFALQRVLQDVATIVSPENHMEDARRIELLRAKFGIPTNVDLTLSIVETNKPAEENADTSAPELPPESPPDAC